MDDYDGQQYDDKDAANHAELLAHTGKDKVRMLAGKCGGGVSSFDTGETAGGKSQTALFSLPAYPVALRVNGSIIRRYQTLFLKVLQTVVPQKRHHGGHGSTTGCKTVELNTHRKEHDKENEHDNGAASKV